MSRWHNVRIRNLRRELRRMKKTMARLRAHLTVAQLRLNPPELGDSVAEA